MLTVTLTTAVTCPGAVALLRAVIHKIAMPVPRAASGNFSDVKFPPKAPESDTLGAGVCRS